MKNLILCVLFMSSLFAGDPKKVTWEWDGKLVECTLNTGEKIKVKWIFREPDGDMKVQLENDTIMTYHKDIILEVKGKILDGEPEKYVWCVCPCNSAKTKEIIRS